MKRLVGSKHYRKACRQASALLALPEENARARLVKYKIVYNAVQLNLYKW